MFFSPHFHALEILGYSISTWIIFYWIGQIAKAGIVFSETKRLNLNERITGIIFILQIIVGEFFAKIVFLIAQKFLHQDLHLYPKWGNLGRVYLGGEVGRMLSTTTTTLITKQSKQNIFKYFDVFLLGSIASLFFYRLSNILYHAHIGKVTTVPWGFYYSGEIRHETGLYSVISLAILFLIAWKLRTKIQVPGFLALIIISWISLSRFVIDFFRRSDRNMNYRLWDTITVNQIVFSLLFIVSISIIVYLIKNKKVFKINNS